jgi:hypothetical protein
MELADTMLAVEITAAVGQIEMVVKVYCALFGQEIKGFIHQHERRMNNETFY